MTLLEHYEWEREQGIEIGREEERKNTEQALQRAEAAEAEVRRLREQVSDLTRMVQGTR